MLKTIISQYECNDNKINLWLKIQGLTIIISLFSAKGVGTFDKSEKKKKERENIEALYERLKIAQKHHSFKVTTSIKCI